MELRKHGDALVRKPPVDGAPTITILFGGDPGGPAVGVVQVEVPPGGRMPEHRHGGSDVVLVPVAGTVTISKGTESITVNTGDAALVSKDEAVSLANGGAEPARIVVAAGPADFVAQIRQWPEPDASQ